ncbi:hypothetical protein QCA50_011358 [Cerrena zonata]|uniref:Peptidase C14 caspase domain-containing protein n=1 Tax=Cerrena zonata TaxID=2478898 RepID=A0AAW0G5C0_9APHY
MFPARQSLGNPGRPPQKKALIIGICYRTREVTEDYGHLSAPHSDAEAMREMLTRHYGYEEHNVTVMLDRKDVMDQTPHLAPTREHILREVANLVSGAQPGDIFVFHFSGHCDQIKCKNGSEDDGLDEALLPMDHQGLKRENLIRDNKLRKLLVNRLPVGAHLTAFLDSCHSGTLLDLDHYACMNGTSPICPRNLRTQRRSRCSKAAARSTGSRIVHSYGVNDHEVQSRESSIMESSSPPGTPRRLSVRTRTSSTHTLANDKTVSMGQVMDTITDVTNLNTPAAEGEPSILHDEGRFILGG